MSCGTEAINKSEELEVVQELADSGLDLPPNRYILEEKDRPHAAVPLASDIPVIDIDRLSQHHDEADKLSSAARSCGIFQVVGHNLSPALLDEIQDVARIFFKLPMEAKQKYSNLTGGEFKLEGYGNDRVVSEHQIIDWNDRLYLQVQPEEKRTLDLWPENPASFREILHEFTTKTRKITELILRALAKVIKLEENYFIDKLDHTAEVHARFTYYPRCSSPDLVFGIKPHSDGSVMTIVLPDKKVAGLQVLRNGEWVSVPIIPHALVVNMGNQMEVMSNGIFKSPVHRVLTSSEERISVVMFYALDREKMLEPAEGLVDETRPSLYRKMKSGDFLTIFFQKFSEGETSMEWLKV